MLTITITWKRVAIGLLLAGMLSNAWWAAAYRSQQIVTAHAAPIAPVAQVSSDTGWRDADGKPVKDQDTGWVPAGEPLPKQ